MATSADDEAGSLLRELNGRLDQTLTFELEREIVEVLSEGPPQDKYATRREALAQSLSVL